MFGTVKEGLLGRHLTFVPLNGVTIGPNSLQVAVSKALVKDAPNLELHGEELSQDDESALYHYYESTTPHRTRKRAAASPPKRPREAASARLAADWHVAAAFGFDERSEQE